MKIEAWHSLEDKHRWKVVRTDFFGPKGGDVEGEIITADDTTGECSMQINGETKTLNFGPHNIRIVTRAR